MFKFLSQNKNAIQFSAFQSVYSLALQTVVPFLSIILLESEWTTQQITYFFSIFILAGFLFSPVIGKISDKIGYKKIIIISLIFQATFFMLYFFSNNQYLIYFARFLDGIAFAVASITALSAFENLIKKDRGLWTGIYLSLGTIGALLGPVMAGYVAENFSSRYLLIISAIFALLATLFLISLPEKKILKNKKIKLTDFNPLSEIGDFLKFRKLQGMAILGILMNSKNQIYVIFFPILVIKTLNIDKQYLGILLAIPALFHIFQFYYGKLADRVSPEFGTLLGVFMVSTSLIFIPYVKSIKGLIAVLIMFGIGGGIWNVNAWTLMGNVAKEKRIEGEVVGTYSSLAKLGMFFATIFSASIIEYFGISKTLQIFAITILISNCIAYFFFAPIFHHKNTKHTFHKIMKTT